MKDEDLKTILEISNKATKAPWTSYVEGRDHEGGSNFIMTGSSSPDGEERDYDIEIPFLRVEDQDFIALARNVVPQLIEEILRLKKILRKNSLDPE